MQNLTEVELAQEPSQILTLARGKTRRWSTRLTHKSLETAATIDRQLLHWRRVAHAAWPTDPAIPSRPNRRTLIVGCHHPDVGVAAAMRVVSAVARAERQERPRRTQPAEMGNKH